MDGSLVFLLAREPELPQGRTDAGTLRQVQRRGVTGGTALKLYRLSAEAQIALDTLPLDGEIAGARERGSGPVEIICDAVIPHLEVKSLWLGVYAPAGGGEAGAEAGPETVLEEVDRFALREAENETCWFYPTEDGRYLSWEQKRSLELLPGRPVEAVSTCTAADYRRTDVHVLWSLMADDEALTCVGLTYRRRRLEWPLHASRPESCATWACFEVDAMADPSFRAVASHTLFRAPG